MRARRATALFAGFALALAAGSATAQTDDAAQVRAYLDNGMAVHRALGYAPDPGAPDIVVPLTLDHPYLWSVYMRAGETYRVYGACDDDCSDLDMEIYGADGNLADRDTTRNDTPYVQIRPAQSGRVYVRIWLYACSAEPCTIAARVVEGGRAVERR
jgi:hypothetical protein